MRRLVKAVVFLDSALSQDLAHVLIYARAEIFKKFFIFLLHFRYDEFRFFKKLVFQKDRFVRQKKKQKRFRKNIKVSRTTGPILQSVPMILAPTLVSFTFFFAFIFF